MKTMPKLAHLTMFKDIVHCGSLHEAAKKLAISQPTLSRVLKELEMTVGARLLERSNRGVRLTAVGELFYRRIDAATNQLLNAFDELRGLSADGEAPAGGDERRSAAVLSASGARRLQPPLPAYPGDGGGRRPGRPAGPAAKLRAGFGGQQPERRGGRRRSGHAGAEKRALLALSGRRSYRSRAAAGRGQMGGAALLLGGACRHPRIAERYTPHGQIVETDSFLATVPGQAARLYRAAERSGGRTLRPAAAPAENPDARIDISARFTSLPAMSRPRRRSAPRLSTCCRPCRRFEETGCCPPAADSLVQAANRSPRQSNRSPGGSDR